MTERQWTSESGTVPGTRTELPAPDVVAFIRYCHRRRGLKWPELYDEMCGVAARREFNGWDHDELAGRGVAFSLFDMPRLATWARAVLAHEDELAAEPQRQMVAPALEAAVA